MWDLPRPGLEPVSPALAGGFLTTVPPGKSSTTFYLRENKMTEAPLALWTPWVGLISPGLELGGRALPHPSATATPVSPEAIRTGPQWVVTTKHGPTRPPAFPKRSGCPGFSHLGGQARERANPQPRLSLQAISLPTRLKPPHSQPCSGHPGEPALSSLARTAPWYEHLSALGPPRAGDLVHAS